MDKVIGWWSGGVTSAVTCKLIIDLYGKENCEIIFIDTFNEDRDTYRFKDDCEAWYGLPIKTITAIGEQFTSIEAVWFKYLTLNTATGAICSSTLKRDVRLKWEKENTFKHQAFGFDLKEANRAKSMTSNHPQAKAIYPLLLMGLFKKDCVAIIEAAGIKIPDMYYMGYENNNCGKTGCIQGGIGYWQLIKIKEPKKFNYMAWIEHKITDLKGEPVTMLKDQSNGAKESGNTLVFLKPHPDYPHLKSIDDMKGRPPKPILECNGLCGTNDFDKRNQTESEINFAA